MCQNGTTDQPLRVKQPFVLPHNASHADPAESFGVRLGALAPRGERGTLIVGNDLLTRMSSNPFFAYLLARVDEGIAQAPKRP